MGHFRGDDPRFVLNERIIARSLIERVLGGRRANGNLGARALRRSPASFPVSDDPLEVSKRDAASRVSYRQEAKALTENRRRPVAASTSRCLFCRCVSADFVVRKIGARALQFGGENGVHFTLLLGSQNNRRGALFPGAHHKRFAAPGSTLKRGEAFVDGFHVVERRLPADFPNDFIGNPYCEKLRHTPHGRFEVSFHRCK